MEKINLVTALFRLSQLCEKRGKTHIEDRYCCICTIDSKIKTVLDPRNTIPDEPKEYVVGVCGIYLNSPDSPGGAEPVYRVVI
jgi:hypothetical protein